MLDCYDLADLRRQEVLFSFSEALLSALRPALEGLAASGVELDPYGTTRLYPNQIARLLELAPATPHQQAALREELAQLRDFLARRVAAGAGVLIEGE